MRNQGRHFNHYMIWNLSQRHYDYKVFYDMIQCLGWPDHHAPALSLLFKIVSAMDSYLLASSCIRLDGKCFNEGLIFTFCRWLKADKNNVAVVHCMVRKLIRLNRKPSRLTSLYVKGGQGPYRHRDLFIFDVLRYGACR